MVLKITIVAVGRDKDRWVTDGIAHFTKLLSRWASVSIESPTVKTAASLSPAEIMDREATALENYIGSATTIALSDRGTAYESADFARWLERLQSTSGGRVTFLIGGPYGLAQSILDRADHILSLSPLTFSHQLVRLVLLEQLYRGFSILRGTDYHK
ncbi:23S rRNA (pseudouridine(1915)-N(3))-methyltransferase RlmH [candidate division GN15 bacterium]|nr:23S rRNA (pseudouridine(1915)-N(3))-methyltransferase RlmH [candidate division GN15 bacterium]